MTPLDDAEWQLQMARASSRLSEELELVLGLLSRTECLNGPALKILIAALGASHTVLELEVERAQTNLNDLTKETP